MIGYGTWGFGGRDYGPIKFKKSLKLLEYAYKSNIFMYDTPFVWRWKIRKNYWIIFKK